MQLALPEGIEVAPFAFSGCPSTGVHEPHLLMDLGSHPSKVLKMAKINQDISELSPGQVNVILRMLLELAQFNRVFMNLPQLVFRR